MNLMGFFLKYKFKSIDYEKSQDNFAYQDSNTLSVKKQAA